MTGDAATTPGRSHREPARGGDGKFTRSLETADRDAKAARLRTRGATYQQIADALGYADKSNARHGVMRALDATVEEPARELRAMLADRLDALTRKAWGVLEGDHFVVSNAGAVVKGPDGQPMRDPGPVLAAIRELRSIAAEYGKLYGAHAPVRVEAEIGPRLVTLEEVEYTVAHLREQVEAERRAVGIYVPAASGDEPDADDTAPE